MTAPAPDVAVEIPEALGFLFEPPLGAVRYRGAYGGRGSAKSWSIARALLIKGAEAPLRILCARQYQSSIRDSVHKLLWDQLREIGLDGFYTVTQTSILGENGTEFIFKGIQRDIEEIKSTEGVDICWVEEAQSVSEEAWLILVPTIRKDGSEIWVSFNPALATDPTYKKFVLDELGSAIIRKVNFPANPFFPEVLRKEEQDLLRKDPEAHANVWLGEPWHRSDAEVLAGKWRVADFEPEPHWQGPYFGADWGFSKDPSTLVGLFIADNVLYLRYQQGGVQLGFDDTERRFRRVPGAENHTIRADSARPETINDMRRRGLNVVGAPKWTGCEEDGIEHLRNYREIVIHPSCTLAIQEARHYRYKTDRKTGDVLPAVIDANNHTWDASRYALSPLIRRRTKPRLIIGNPNGGTPQAPPPAAAPVRKKIVCLA
jgi:phage terminase large subunit